jgi:hypothetical protein
MSRLREWASRSVWRVALLALVGLFILIQFVPYGHSHSNPPVTRAADFDSERTAHLFSDACGDCHSNETSWPIESNVAPFSWLIVHDVDDGRAVFNVSEWDRLQPDASEVIGTIAEGDMPPLQYKPLHPAARLSDSEKADLEAGLRRTYQRDPPGP